MDNSKDKQGTEYFVTLYGPKDDTQRGNGAPEGENPYTLFDYRASLGVLSEGQLDKFLADGKFSSHRTKPLCPCCPHLFVVEPLQNVGNASNLQHYQATIDYANLKDARVHAKNCKGNGAIVAEFEWLKGLADSIRGEMKIGASTPTPEKPREKIDDDKLLGAAEAIKLFGGSRSTFYRRVNDGLIEKQETKTGTYYPESSVLKCKRDNP